MNYNPNEYSDVQDISTDSVRFEQPSTHALLEYSQLNADLQEVYLILSGQVYDSENEKIIKNKFTRPLLNEQGVNAIIIQLKPYFSRSATFGKMGKEGIQLMLKATLKNIKAQLFSRINQERWDLHSSDWETIMNAIMPYITFNLNRSKEGNELDKITSSIQSREVTSQTANNPKPKKILGMFKYQ